MGVLGARPYLALTDVSKSVSAVSFGDLDSDANHVGGDVSWTPPVSDANIKSYKTYLATDAAGSSGAVAGSMAVGTNVYADSSGAGSTGKSHYVAYTKFTLAEQTTPAALALTDVSKSASTVSFGELDLDANHLGGDVPWTPPVSDASIKTCEMYLATDAAGPGGALPGSMAVSSNVYAVSSDADRMGKPPIMVYTKSTLAEQTAPAALALTDVSKSVSAVSFGNLDLDVNHVGGGVSWSPPVSDVNIKTYESYLATDAAGSGGALAGRMAVATYGYAVSSETDGTGKSHIVVYIESTMAGQTTQAALALTDVS